MAVDRYYVEERLRAYILPRKPETAEQEEAFEIAVDAQVDYETTAGADGIPGNAVSVSNDGVSVTFASSAGQAGYSSSTISPAAWAILRNAGLIAYTLPTARKL